MAKKQSQYHGVTWDVRRNRWVAQIYIKALREKSWIGSYPGLGGERKAAIAYDKARIKLGLYDGLNILKPLIK